MTASEIDRIVSGVLDSEPHDMGEGLRYRIMRDGFKSLYSSFPGPPSDENLTKHVRGKTFVVWGSGDVGRGNAVVARALGGEVAFIDVNDGVLSIRRREFGSDGFGYINSKEAGAQTRIDDILSSPDTAGVTLGALVKGDRAPLLLTRERLRRLNDRRTAAGARPLIVVDGQIDQGGGTEGVKPTTHNMPFMAIEGSPVYAVANVPGSAYTAAYASTRLEEATLEDTKTILLARAEGTGAFDKDPLIKTSLNTWEGLVTDEKVARFFKREYKTPDESLNMSEWRPQGRVVFGVAAEIKDYENRVGLLPSGVGGVVSFAKANGLDVEVLVEEDAGRGVGVTDEDYRKMGAKTKPRQYVLSKSDVLKGVKEPMGDQFRDIKAGTWVYTYFHYAGMRDSTMLDWAVKNRIGSFAYETRVDGEGMLPQLKCMSDVDGRSNALVITAATNPAIVEITYRTLKGAV